jgi:D-alanyl-D-alanine carboxypeptidase
VPLARTRVRAAREGLSVRAIVLPDLEAMAEAAERSGAGLLVSSAYRSYEYQQGLFERSVRAEGREQTERELALPGHSEHQLGTAVDFGSVDASFADTAAGKWLASEAWRYGFVLSYPLNGEAETGYIYEPWHFRYVGRPAAAMVHAFFGGDREAFLAFYGEKESYFRDRSRKSG